ncbi:MAG: GNAT family N-acetyltransferase [Anaerolineaceae bacterium]|nr:GNAT family N-acetyltransferase [Anaerolineaceae bacterium]
MTPIPDTLVITFLEMTDRDQFRPSFLDANALADCRMLPLKTADLDYYLFLYGSVGRPWRWIGRLRMDRGKLRQQLERPGVSVDVLYVGGTPAGYIELARVGPHTEVAYFGLRVEYFGRGLGKHLLSLGLQRAWDDGAGRVWVNTCNLDGPHALVNYRKRGFQIYLIEEVPMPTEYAEASPD